MAFQILPQEFHVLADHYVIRTRVPAGELTDDMLLQRVRNANLDAGAKLVVQCMDHGYETLLAEAEYRIVQRRDSLKTVEVDDRNIRQVNQVDYMIARVSAWWTSPLNQPAEPKAEQAGHTVKWNAGKQAHEVIGPGGEVLASYAKDQGGKAAAESHVAALTPKAA